MTVANVSQYLQTLHNAKLVSFKKQGNFVFYELADSSIIDFIRTLHSLSEKQLVQVQLIQKEFQNKHFQMDGLFLIELKNRMDNGEVLLLDVRPKEEYDEEHIPGAISIPIEELKEKLVSLPSNCDAVAYCRGPYCLISVEAIELLTTKGG